MQKQNPKESRMDRIEKGLELLLQGTGELRESQFKTDEQILDLKEQILELKEIKEETFRKLDTVGRQLADLGVVQGEVAEYLFYRNNDLIFMRKKEVASLHRI